MKKKKIQKDQNKFGVAGFSGGYVDRGTANNFMDDLGVD